MGACCRRGTTATETGIWRRGRVFFSLFLNFGVITAVIISHSIPESGLVIKHRRTPPRRTRRRCRLGTANAPCRRGPTHRLRRQSPA